LDEALERSPLERFCAVLAEHGVEFMVISGQAEVLMGSARVTYDVDLCYRRTPDNLERLAVALGTLNLTVRGAPPELKFRLDAQALALGQNYTFEVDGEYPLDFLGHVEPIGVRRPVAARRDHHRWWPSGARDRPRRPHSYQAIPRTAQGPRVSSSSRSHQTPARAGRVGLSQFVGPVMPSARRTVPRSRT
jgi:hypothetical protein